MHHLPRPTPAARQRLHHSHGVPHARRAAATAFAASISASISAAVIPPKAGSNRYCPLCD